MKQNYKSPPLLRSIQQSYLLCRNMNVFIQGHDNQLLSVGNKNKIFFLYTQEKQKKMKQQILL